ncbi:MAG: DUF3300 domain-containing protein [Candidatus Acidiferrales bacterium]
MRKILAVGLVLFVLCAQLPKAAAATGAYPALATPPQDQSSYQPYSADQLENLLAPIALYPDPLLAQVLPAATFPDQIDEAARYVRSYGQNGIDDQPWDVSVKSVAHYPTVLYMMADKMDWTTAVGQTYVYQSTDVMTAVQHLRAMARSQGNLVTSPQQQVVEEGGYIQIWPAQPQYVFVPVYDPAIVYVRRPFFGVAVGFGAGFLIGAWLNRDCDWRDRRVFYHGWRDDDNDGWRGRSRTYVQINNVYVNNRYTNVTVNRTVVNRAVNVTNINNYNSVHRNVTYNNVVRSNTVINNNTVVNKNTVVNSNNRVNNQVINRNINTNDPRLNQYRGHQNLPPTTPQSFNRTVPEPSRTVPQSFNRTVSEPNRTVPQSSNRTVPEPSRTVPQSYHPPAAPPTAKTQYNPGPHAFGKSEYNFESHAASERGQASRVQAARPPAPSPPSGGGKPSGGNHPHGGRP